MIAIPLCLVMSSAFALTVAAYGAESSKAVRGGWYESPFNRTDQFGRKSGFAYECQQKIAAYTGWDYEYVEGNWPELLQMLIDGEIDLLSDVSYTPERSELMLYSSLPMGREEYFAFVSPQSESGVHSGDYASFNGKRIGVNKGTYQEAILRDWLVKRGVQAEIVELTETEDNSVRRLQRGEIDVYISLHAYSGSLDITPVCKIGSSDFFFAVSKNRPELLRELNSAMSGIQDENIYYIEYLQDKYLSYSGTNLFLTQSELKWLAEHGPIRVGYRDNYMPFCAQDKPASALTGALNEFLALASGIMKNAEIEFAAVPFTTISDAVTALKKGEIDCIFPVNLTDYDGEELGVLLTLPLMQTEMDVAVRSATQRDFSLESDVIVADSGEDPNYETFLLDCFPNWKHERFENMEACFQSVADGKTDCALVSAYRLNILAGSLDAYKLSPITTGETMGLSFAVRRRDTNLCAILNKAVKLVPASSVHAALAAYSFVEQPVTFSSFLRENTIPALAGVCVILTIILALLLRSFRSERRTREALANIATLNGNLSNSQVKLKDALQASEQANRAKTAFLAKMSHEIRTPMNAIIGFTSLMREHADDRELILGYIEKISSASRHLLSLINDVLDMSYIESDRLSLQEEEFNFQDFLTQTNAVMEKQRPDKGLEYSCYAPT